MRGSDAPPIEAQRRAKNRQAAVAEAARTRSDSASKVPFPFPAPLSISLSFSPPGRTGVDGWTWGTSWAWPFFAGWRTERRHKDVKAPGHGSGAPGWQKDGANVLHRQTSSWQMTSQVGERDSSQLASEAIDLEAWLRRGWIEVGRFSPAPLNGRMDGPRWRVGRA
ncbi:uncharacterized protein Triagg1_7346 [Trichoderma aggressivum f. europaeum]|uniref:Uncharacterized protein n=1 Tax=Trichoderma aggressivum f. europaeum TaxID=173218 RepID=A0AAE1M0X8_9HYPO|nr:hypothetical protein Triagg1_7346 [Trichoderma aggressivum f. europaeum]